MKNSSSQISDEERQEILAVIRGEVAIPVYATDEGVKRYEIWNCTEDPTIISTGWVFLWVGRRPVNF